MIMLDKTNESSASSSNPSVSSEYFYLSDFDDAQECARILERESNLCQQSGEDAKLPKNLPRHLASIWRTDLLTGDQEQSLFRKLNCIKHLMAQASELGNDSNRVDKLNEMLLETRNQIVEANMRLVFSLVKKYENPGSIEFDELLSAGYSALIRAVDLFDFRRGSKFSTYAYTSIQRSCFGHFRRESKRRERIQIDAEAHTDAVSSDNSPVPFAGEEAESIEKLLKHLGPRERYILTARFGIGAHHDGLTFRKIGKKLGISGTRVAQIFHETVEQLRSTVDDNYAIAG